MENVLKAYHNIHIIKILNTGITFKGAAITLK